MTNFLRSDIVHVMVVLCILSRLADIGTTYLVSPTLKLEANVIVRRFRWKFGWLTVLAGLIPYWSMTVGVIVTVASFFVASSNAGKILMAKALGEEETAQLFRRIILAAPPVLGWFYLFLPALLFSIPGFIIILFLPDPNEWGYWFGDAIVTYAVIVAFWSAVRYYRIRTAG